IKSGHGAAPYLVSPTGTQAKAALRALQSAFGREPVLLREGGSIPIVNQFKSVLGADSLLLGLALPDDNAHSPNEKFDLDCFEKGRLMAAHLWQGLAKPAGARRAEIRNPQCCEPPYVGCYRIGFRLTERLPVATGLIL